MNSLLHSKCLWTLVLLFALPLVSRAQLSLVNEPQPVSPQAAGMTRYGKNDVNLYTGRISVSIPLYEYKDADFDIPLSLNYSYNGLQPNSQASEAGLGWSVSCGGTITREVCGFPDEETSFMRGFESLAPQCTDIRGFDELPFEQRQQWVNVFGCADFDSENAGSLDVLKSYYNYQGTFYDANSDVYHFSFPGHSGSFKRRTDGTFVVFHTGGANGEYKVTKTNASFGDSSGSKFSEIVITTGDGYKYYFGSLSDKNEFNERSTTPVKETEGELETIISWKLRRIEAPNGHTVTFRYTAHGESERNIYNYRPAHWHYTSESGSSHQASTSIVNTVCSPLYSVKVDGSEIIGFEYQQKTANQLASYVTSSGLQTLDATHNTLLLQCITYSGVITTLSYQFSQSGNKYPFLTEVRTTGVGSYKMEYEYRDSDYFPPLGTTATDHWGYFNKDTRSIIDSHTVRMDQISSVNTSTYEETLRSYKSPNPNVAKYGIMNRLTYPTGGYTEFEYESNNYSKQILKHLSTSFAITEIAASGTGPGFRIKEVKNYNSDNVLSDRKTYSYYETEGVANSSGRLLSSPRYQVMYGGVCGQTAIFSRFATLGGLPFYDSVPVEYYRVEETDREGGRTVYHFSDYDSAPDFYQRDFTAINRMFRGVSGYYYSGIASITDKEKINNLLEPPGSRQFDRGKLMATEVYDNNRNLLLKTENDYNFDSPVEFIDEFVNVGDSYGKIPRYVGDHNIRSSSQTEYYGGASAKSGVDYFYNALGQKRIERRLEPDGDSVKVEYKYIPDIPVSSRTQVQRDMYAANVISTPVEVITSIKKKNSSVWLVRSQDRYTFSPFTGTTGDPVYRISRWEKYDTDAAVYRIWGEYLYDRHGSMIEAKDANGTYTSFIWGNDRYGVAIQVSGLSNAQISGIPDMPNVFTDGIDPGIIQLCRNAVRSVYPLSECTSFEYSKYGLVTKSIDPAGRTSLYTYDDNDRLLSVSEGGQSSMERSIEKYDYNTVTK